MPPRRKSGFFGQEPRPQDAAARQSDLEAVLTPRRTFPQDIAVDLIAPNPFQPRRTFTDLDELAATIQQQGFTSRLRVRQHPERPGTFQLVYGERRLRAAQQAGLTAVPCDVADHSDDDLIEIGLAENIQRRDLDPLEEAQAFQVFIDERGYSIRRLAERIGKDKSYVEDRLTLLRTPADVQAMIVQRPDALRAAREIAKIADPAEREPLVAGVLAGTLNTTQVRERVRAVPPAPPRTHADTAAAMQATIAREAQQIQAILARWKTLAADDTAVRALITTQTIAVLHDVQHLIDTLEQ